MNPLTLVRLQGTQAEMGAQYGALIAERGDLAEARALMTTLSSRLLRDANHQTLVGRATGLAVQALLAYGRGRMERRRPAAYQARGHALLAAAGLPRGEGRHVALMDVFQTVVGVAARLRLGPFAAAVRPVPACSSLAAWGQASDDGQLRHARNLDLPCVGAWESAPAVVLCDPDEGLRYGYVGAFGLDAPGTTSFNEAGLTVAAHTRFHEEATFAGGAVVDVCHEISHKAESLADAERIVRQRQPAAPWGLMVTSAREGGAAIFETTGRRVRRVDPGPGAEHLSCTNWHRHPDLVDRQVAPFPAWTEHAESRRRRLDEIAGEEPVDRMALMRALGDHRDPGRSGERAAGGVTGQATSVTSVVFEAEAQRMCVSVGDTPTGWGPYVEVGWDWDGPVGAFAYPEVGGAQAPVVAERRPLASGEEAYACWRKASRADVERHDSVEVLGWAERAVDGAPFEPAYRFMAGVLRLRQGDWGAGLTHLEAAIEGEGAPFRRAQAQLWAARALEVLGRGEEAAVHRRAVMSSEGPWVGPLRAQAAADADRPVSGRRLRRLHYSVDLVDASL